MRRRVLLLVGIVLSGLIGVAPAGRADSPNPLYGLVDAAAQRLQTADPVAAFKWVDGGSIEDAPRVRQVLDAVGADATRHGIDEAFVRAAFSDQIHATEGIEYTRFGQWKLDPAVAPTSAPDLSESRTAIDGFNRSIVDEMAEHWDLLRGQGCEQAVNDARTAVVTDRQLDPLYDQALTFATHSYCG